MLAPSASAHQRHGGCGIGQQASAVVDWPVDQIRQLATVVAAHHPRANGRGEDVGNGLAQVRIAAQGAAGGGVHADHGTGPLEMPVPRWMPAVL